jgi:hypothetical protein
MKISRFFILLLLTIISFGKTYAAKSVHVLDGLDIGIVIDTNGWYCRVEAGGVYSKIFPSSGYYLKAEATHRAITLDLVPCDKFLFYTSGTNEVLRKDIQDFLIKYAQAKGTIFSNVTLKKTGLNLYVVDGAYFDDISSGYFALLILLDNPVNQGHMQWSKCFAFLKVEGDTLNEQVTESIFQEVYTLITPLYASP